MASPGQPADKQARFCGFQALRLLGTSPVGRGAAGPRELAAPGLGGKWLH